MRSGSLRHRITFQRNEETFNDFGESITSWVSIVPDEWVQIIPLKSDETYRSKKLNAEVNHKIRMRYRSDIDSTLRIEYGSRIFDIDSVINVRELNKELQIMATEVL